MEGIILRRLRFENSRGKTISFDITPFFIDSLTGLSEVAVNLQSQQSPYLDGDTHIDTLIQPRFPSLEGTIIATDEKSLKIHRQEILRVCNPKLGMGKLIYENDGDVKEIDGLIDGVPVFPEIGEELYQTFMINWKCPDPYWKNPNHTSKPLRSYVGNFTLPFTLPFELGVSGSRTLLFNEGDVPAPVRIDIQGPVANPQIMNHTTGEWLRVNRSIAADEILHIDTTPGQKRVEIYRGNQVYSAFGYLDHNSEWITLEVGENQIEHIADAGDNTSLVAVTWNSYFTGI